jgi:flagellar motor protein MotB
MRLMLCFLAAGLAAADVTVEQVNKAIGLELFADANLWDDDAKAVAERLSWPQESETTNDASYRLYPKDDYRIFECRPYSCAFISEMNKPSTLSLMFANKGDAVSISARDVKDKTKAKARDEQIKDYKKAIADDAKDLEEKLTKLFGKPTMGSMGQAQATREVVRRWNWNGHAFLLAAPKDEYVALRILSMKSADEGGRSRVSDAELFARAKTRVEKRPNGDVILKDIPMVNQGPKGYCAPATWERAMRYMGVPADMYVLAMAGQSGAGGGTSIVAIAAGAKDAVTRGGRKLESFSGKIDPSTVAKYIDRGLPIMWVMFSTKQYNDIADGRTKEREGMTDPAAWKKAVADGRKGQKPLQPNRNEGHVCMIIGYNKETGEVAVSDSWGPQFEERWILGVEATQVSQGTMTVIGF